jgi:AAA domain
VCTPITPKTPWRSGQEGIVFWFDEANTEAAIDTVLHYYNDGKLPNSTLLLNPVVHEWDGERYVPKGSGVIWMTAFALGIAYLTPDQIERLHGKNVLCSHVHRGENTQAGLKALAFLKEAQAPLEDGRTVEGCRELYNLTNVKSDGYASSYLLSGMNYLCLHGIFQHPNSYSLLPDDCVPKPVEQIVAERQQDYQVISDAVECWEAYDRIHSLYVHFGQDTKDIPHNNRFFNLCARDLRLFDKTGPMRKGSDETFQFVVPGLIPRGAVTLLAAPGGTGKSSVAHMLCVFASIDLEEDDPTPVWLGQEINRDCCKGICIYFSGEDGPAIVNARGSLFDPKGKALRLQFHRNEFQDMEMSFGDYLLELRKMPDVSIVVIDPARKYLSGDENDADVVSEFFEAIEEFAITKNCGMIVVHHLQKGAKPTNAREVLDELRGSQVFIDRPRVVMGMCRNDKHTIVGLAKCNIPPNLGMVTEERIFTRNPENLQLIWLPGEAGVRRDYLTKEEIEAMELAEFEAQLQKKPTS